MRKSVVYILDWFKDKLVAGNQGLGLEGPRGPLRDPSNLAWVLPCHPPLCD